MLITLVARFGCNICSFLYPAYASYKALSIHPQSGPVAENQVERWLMYWAVVGTWTAVEAVIGWTFTWLPFYSLIKTCVFLYLSLPQSEGSSYIYRTHLEPFFNDHEADIDAFLASLRTRAGTAAAGAVAWAWERVKAQLNVALPAQGTKGEHLPPGGNDLVAAGIHQPPSLQDPASGAVQQLYGYASHYTQHYMPLAVSALSAAAASASSASRSAPVRSVSSSDPERAEQVPESIEMPIPVPTPSPRAYPSDSSLRSRTYLHAQQQARLQPRSVSSPSGRLSGSSSEESIGSATAAAKWNGEMSYEQIGRDEAAGVPPSGMRPEMEKRRSSWWAWGGGPTIEPDKTE